MVLDREFSRETGINLRDRTPEQAAILNLPERIQELEVSVRLLREDNREMASRMLSGVQL